MTALLISLFARVGLSQALSRVLGYVAVALCAGLLWVRGSRYEAQRDTARAQVAELQATLEQVKVAEKRATDAALAAKAKAERDYKTLAETTDAEEQKARDTAMADAERYIADHRVRPQAAGGASRPASPAPEDHGSTGSDSAGPAPIVDAVAVTPDDIRICTTNTTRLEAVRAWALSLEAVSPATSATH